MDRTEPKILGKRNLRLHFKIFGVILSTTWSITLAHTLQAPKQLKILRSGFTLAYCTHACRTYAKMQEESAFRTKTFDANLLKTVIAWRMAFGVDSTEVHWKRVVGGESEY